MRPPSEIPVSDPEAYPIASRMDPADWILVAEGVIGQDAEVRDYPFADRYPGRKVRRYEWVGDGKCPTLYPWVLADEEGIFCESSMLWNRDEDCFVVTAASGDPFVLSNYYWLRDNVLPQSHLGQRFRDWYYGGAGQRMAELIGDYPLLRQPSRALVNAGSSAIGLLRDRIEKRNAS